MRQMYMIFCHKIHYQKNNYLPAKPFILLGFRITFLPRPLFFLQDLFRNLPG